MLAEQQKQLVDLAAREESQYRPLLASYFAYDEAVRNKLEKMADQFQAASLVEVASELSLA
jgi:hypothetical protein